MSRTRRQVIAMGGGGFSMEPDDLRLDAYVLEQAGVDDPCACFVPTASGDSLEYTARFHAALGSLGCRTRDLRLFDGPVDGLERALDGVDVVYVGGGNTRNLLVLWREWGLDALLRAAYERGTVMAGISAGMICWFEQGVTDSIPGQLVAWPCLGWLPGSACPHYDGESMRRPRTHELLRSGALVPGVAADDGAALHYVDERRHAVVASRPGARAYETGRGTDGAPTETPLETRLLPPPDGGDASSSIAILRAHPAHHAGILEVASALPEWFTERGRRQIEVDVRTQATFIAQVDERVVGFATGFTQEGGGWLGWIGVHPDLGGHGLGRRLVGAVARHLAAAGATHMDVHTVGDGVDYEPYARTRAFYRAVGFVDHRVERLDDPECPEQLTLRMPLAAPDR